MNTENPNGQREDDNPYRADQQPIPEYLTNEVLDKPVLSATYWIVLSLTVCMFLLLILIQSPTWSIAFGTGLIAILRSGLLVHKVKSGKYYSTGVIPTIDERVFFITSWIFGGLNLIGGCVAFVAICFPLGLGVMAISPSSEAAMILLGGLVGVISIGLAVRLVIIIVWATLPYLPSSHRLDSIAHE